MFNSSFRMGRTVLRDSICPEAINRVKTMNWNTIQVRYIHCKKLSECDELTGVEMPQDNFLAQILYNTVNPRNGIDTSIQYRVQNRPIGGKTSLVNVIMVNSVLSYQCIIVYYLNNLRFLCTSIWWESIACIGILNHGIFTREFSWEGGKRVCLENLPWSFQGHLR